MALCNSLGNGRKRMPMYKVCCLESEMHPRCPGHPSGRALCQSPGRSRGTRLSPLPSGSLKPKGLHKVMSIDPMISAHLKGCSKRRRRFYLPSQGGGRGVKDRQQRVGKGMPNRASSAGGLLEERRHVCGRTRTWIYVQHGPRECLRETAEAGVVRRSEGPGL